MSHRAMPMHVEVLRLDKTRFGSERHLVPSRRFDGGFRSNASSDRVGPKRLLIEHIKAYLMT